LNRTTGFIALLAAVLLGTTLLASACGGDDGHGAMNMTTGNGPAGSIKVNLVNWAIQPAKTSTKAGSVTFHVVHDMQHMHTMNEGGNAHDLQVARKNADGIFEIVGQVQGLQMGDEKDLTLNLTPGDYELQCNVTEELNGQVIAHYVKGMHTTFKVS
jgi:hypothetical protein